MGFLDTFMVVHNREIANSNARSANSARAIAQENLEEAVRQAAIKNAALREIKRLDPNNWLLNREARGRVGDEGEAFYRRTGNFPQLPPEIAE